MPPLRIVIAEDNERLGELHRDFFMAQGFEVLWVQQGDKVSIALEEFAPNVLILDLTLPVKSGIDVCRDIRATFDGKILILTASEDDFDHVTCLELGADDFVCKPINPRVLLARLRMILRKRSPELKPQKHPDHIRAGTLSLKRLSRETVVNGINVRLTDSEFKLLWKMACNIDQPVTRADLFATIRGIEFDGVDRSVDTKIVALRKKLGDNGEIPKRIITIRNQGYMLVSDGWG